MDLPADHSKSSKSPGAASNLPRHELLHSCYSFYHAIEKFEFIVSERVQVNPDNSRAMSALTFLLFKLNTLQTNIVKS